MTKVKILLEPGSSDKMQSSIVHSLEKRINAWIEKHSAEVIGVSITEANKNYVSCILYKEAEPYVEHTRHIKTEGLK